MDVFEIYSECGSSFAEDDPFESWSYSKGVPGVCGAKGCIRACGHAGPCMSKFVQEIAGAMVLGLDDGVQTTDDHLFQDERLLSDMKQNIANQISLLKVVSSDCCKVDRAVCKLEKEIQNLKHRTTSRKECMIPFISSLTEVGHKMEAGEHRIQELEDELQEERSKVACSQQHIKELQCALDGGCQEQERLQVQLTHVSKSVAIAVASRDNLSVCNQRKQARCMELERQLHTDSLRFENELQRSRSKIVMLEEQIKEQCCKAQAELKSTEESLAASGRELEIKSAQVAELEARGQQTQALENELQKERSKGACSQRCIKELQCSLESARQEQERLQVQLAHVSTSVTTAEASRDNLARQFQTESLRFENELQSSLSRIGVLEEQIKAQSCKAKAELTATQESLAAAVRELERKSAQVSMLEDTNASARPPPPKRWNKMCHLEQEVSITDGNAGQTQQASVSKVLLPWEWTEADLWLLKPGSTHNVPVLRLRFDQKRIHSDLVFSGNHSHDGWSIFKLLEDLIRGGPTPLSVTEKKPLNVFIKESPDGGSHVYSGDNRRLAVFLMFQAISRDSHLEVKCKVCRESKRDNSPTTGLTIGPQNNSNASARHLGSRLFK